MGDQRPPTGAPSGHDALSTRWLPQRPVLVAFALSVLAHVVLLGAFGERRASDDLPGAQRPLSGRLVTAVVVPVPGAPAAPAQAQVQVGQVAPVVPSLPVTPSAGKPETPAKAAEAIPAAEPTAPPVEATRAPVPAPEPPPAPAVPAAPSSPSPPAPAAPEQPALPGTTQAPAPLEFRPSDTASQPPRPRAAPDLGGLGERLVARRLRVTVWVDESGAVRQAQVEPYELKPALVAQLEQAIAAVRFAPALADGVGVATVLQTRLCFDDAGALDLVSQDCWQPVPDEPPAAPGPQR